MSKLIFASCVWYSDRAYYWVRVLIEDIGRRLPLELLCSLYQGQQGDVSHSVHGNLQNPFLRGTKPDSCGRKCISFASVSCKSHNRCGEDGVFKGVKAEVWKDEWLEKKGRAGWREAGAGGVNSNCAWKHLNPLRRQI